MSEFVFKKKYGQNFIRNKYIVERIVKSAIIPDSTLVIEVGVGMGVLTRELVNFSKYVVSYEIDNTLRSFLDKEFSKYNNIEIIYDDFLDRDICLDIDKYNYKHLYFIANVPYYITTPILMKIMQLNKVEKIVMMVQKEVGERLCARCGSKNYSSISVYLDYYYEREILFDVSRYEFEPIPNVDSVIVSFSKKKQLLDVCDSSLFFNIIRDSFQFKRKNIKNNLKNYDLVKIDNILLKYGYSLRSRAEELPLEVFVEISNILYK